VLPDGALADERTQSRLGDGGLDELLGCLWPGDCQTCGGSLGSGPPALVVDELDVLTRASLHHRSCRAPEWNDSFLVRATSSALLSWRTVVLLLPFQDQGREIRAAGLLVNPGLEEVPLARDRGGWHPGVEPSFTSAGLTHPSAGLPIGMPAAGLTGWADGTSLGVSIRGWTEPYESRAEPEICGAVRELGGFLLIVTHAVNPSQLTTGKLMQAFESPATLTGWAHTDPG